MVRILKSLRQLAVIFILAAPVAVAAQDPPPAASEDSDWTRVVRSSPYWVSQGVFSNIPVSYTHLTLPTTPYV